ncbi:hypothetical protein RUM43_001089 [Polyplax serrata]|uniref:Uncharacterized protein n=1 Tax=Polyplax serrata TaxID=468196 RepID=A0AAN8XRH9_POLSC
MLKSCGLKELFQYLANTLSSLIVLKFFSSESQKSIFLDGSACTHETLKYIILEVKSNGKIVRLGYSECLTLVFPQGGVRLETNKFQKQSRAIQLVSSRYRKQYVSKRISDQNFSSSKRLVFSPNQSNKQTLVA